MRLKYVWGYLPLPAYAKTFWARITFSRLTITYLIFSIFHFFIQLALQSKGFAINADVFNAGSAFLERQGGDIKGLPIYINSTLRVCKWVPSNLNLEGGDCDTVWPIAENGTTGQQDNMSQVPTYYADSVSSVPATVTEYPTLATSTPPSVSSAALHDSATSSVVILVIPVLSTSTSLVKGAETPTSAPITTATSVVSPVAANKPGRNGNDDDDDDDGDGLDPEGSEIHGVEGTTEDSHDNDDDLGDVIAQLLQKRAATPTDTPDIDTACLKAWHYPLSILGNTTREDIVFIAFQFWVLGMSVVALLNESIPHIVASLVTHVVATIWGSLQLVHTAHFRTQFGVLITEGACKGIQTPVTSHYWDSRKNVEAVSLAFNALAMFVSCFLSWRLFKLFGWQTFKRVGASRTINRMYKLVLVLSITIQLSFFFVAITVSLWLDRLVNNFIGDLVDFRKAYLASCIITLILLVPWLMMGWFGSRRELRIPMLVFLGLCIVYLGGWGIMFISTTFRWTFITWDLFSIMAVASVLLTLACLTFGLLCRINFDRGLSSHLSPQDEFSVPEDFGIVTPDHKYDDEEKIEFPSTEAPMPTFDAPYGNGVYSQEHLFIGNGSRLHNQGSLPVTVAFPPHALTRSPSYRSTDSFSSEESGSSWDAHSHSRSGSNGYGRTRRWVIE